MKKPQYIKKKKLNQGEEVKKRNESIIAIYTKGGNVDDVEDYLKSIGRSKHIRKDIWNANLQVKEEAKLERDALIQTHVRRYERMFEEHFNKTIDDFAYVPIHMRKYMLIDSLIIAMDALIAKEKVLGLHTKQFRVQLNNFFKKKIVAQYNFHNQNLDDLVRLKYLLAKMKTDEVPVEQYFDDLENETKEAKTIDTDFVEINDKVSDKIKETVKLNKNGNGIPKEIIQDITEKIYKEDLKKHDPQRQDFMQKLKKLNGNGKH